jgi:TolB protein
MTETTIDQPSAARRSICAALVSLPAVSLAQLRVEITGVGSQQFPIAIANFARDGQVPVEIESVVRADLARSGLFRIVDAGSAAIPENAAVSLPDWKARGADALTIGSVSRLADGRFDVRFRLLDTVRGRPARRPVVREPGVRPAPDGAPHRRSHLREAHRRARRVRHPHRVRGADFPQRVGTAHRRRRRRQSAVGPALARADHLAGVVARRLAARLRVVRDRQAGRLRAHGGDRRASAVANFRGSNSAPAWSPDGKTLAVTLTREGNSQVFLMNADGGNVRA